LLDRPHDPCAGRSNATRSKLGRWPLNRPETAARRVFKRGGYLTAGYTGNAPGEFRWRRKRAGLADEYDAAQERGEVRAANERTASNPEAVGVGDLDGLTHKDIHEARLIRDAAANGRMLHMCSIWAAKRTLASDLDTAWCRK
jgi:hypothetical protein